MKLKNEDILKCWRAGKIDKNKVEYCRPLIIQLVDEDLVDEWTRNGRGILTETGFVSTKISVMLIAKQIFLMRKERRKRMQS